MLLIAGVAAIALVNSGLWHNTAVPHVVPPSESPHPALGRAPEFVQMLLALVRGDPFGTGVGWFHPGESRYGRDWLSARFDADRDGTITREEFTDVPRTFSLLDRDQDGALTARDFDWSRSSRMPPPPGLHWTIEMIFRLFTGELGSWFEGPDLGARAPDFTLKTQAGVQEIQLSELCRSEPVVLVFGSFT